MTSDQTPNIHKRRVRYSGKYPRRFAEKYKEQAPERFPDTIERVLASGKTPAGMHRPIMVTEIMEVLQPQPGQIAVDCTVGYGGHTQQLLSRILPGGRLIGLDVDLLELPKTEARLRALGFAAEQLAFYHSNFAGLPKVLSQLQIPGVHMVVADLGVSSMQLDNPERGFSIKQDGPLDMRMNSARGRSASDLLKAISAQELAGLLRANDEPESERLARALAGQSLESTLTLARAVRAQMPHVSVEVQETTIRRVFQALRIAVNDELSALERFLQILPGCLLPGGKAAILTFHSGEDRRVKHAFEQGVSASTYAQVATAVMRATPDERRSNPRSASAKLRWAVRAG